jgi:excisionase family DNA binding protein
VTLEQAAERLHCSVRTVRRRINAGELRASHIGRGKWLIREEDLDDYLDATATRPREVRPLPATRQVQPTTPDMTRRARRRSGDGRLSSLLDRGAA